MNRSARSTVTVLAAVLLLCAGLAAAGAAEQAGATPVLVEGRAAIEDEKSRAETHREAVLDARRNALLQAHGRLQFETRVHGMRLEESLVRARAGGYVESMDVLEAGPVSGSDPPIYRVRARARVRPLQESRERSAMAQARAEPWRPVLALEIERARGDANAGRIGAALADALDRAGIRVVGAGAEEPAARARVEVALRVEDEEESLRVEWTIDAGSEGGGPVGPGAFRGHWRITGREGSSAEWWRQLGAAMALDALRLWASPRWTVLRFEGAEAAQAEALVGAFRRTPGARLRRDEESGALEAGIPLTGNPADFVRGLLRQAGLADKGQLKTASLTRLTYDFSSEAESPEPAGDARGAE
jgi:hypothetical protein